MTRDLVAGALCVGLGAAVAVRAVALHIGSALDPRPGFFPLIGGGLLVVLGSGLMVQSLWRGQADLHSATTERRGPPALLVAGLAIYAALLDWAGYPLMTALVTLLVLRVQQTRWPAAILVSVLLSLASYVLFVRLGVPLPAGRILGG